MSKERWGVDVDDFSRVKVSNMGLAPISLTANMGLLGHHPAKLKVSRSKYLTLPYPRYLTEQVMLLRFT